MSIVELHVDQVVIETGAERDDLSAVPEVLRTAFQLLARRMQRGPLADPAAVTNLTLEKLQISNLSATELLGPRGAERLSDEIYALLVRRIS